MGLRTRSSEYSFFSFLSARRGLLLTITLTLTLTLFVGLPLESLATDHECVCVVIKSLLTAGVSCWLPEIGTDIPNVLP